MLRIFYFPLVRIVPLSTILHDRLRKFFNDVLSTQRNCEIVCIADVRAQSYCTANAVDADCSSQPALTVSSPICAIYQYVLVARAFFYRFERTSQ